jgi:hypothetical protein
LQDSPDSPTFGKQFTEDSPYSPTFAEPFTEYSPDSPTFAKPLTEYSPDSPTFAKGHLEKNVTRLDKFARVIGESREFGASGHCLVILQFNHLYKVKQFK